MRTHPFITAACAVLFVLLAVGLARADEPKPTVDDVQKVADHIDALLAKRWKETNLTPAIPASDAELLRRLYLHLNGSIPPVSEVREYLAETSPDKHRAVVDQL